MLATAVRVSPRFGFSPARRRKHASPLVTIAASGWVTSWAIEAVSSPTVITRLTCASSAWARCKPSSERFRSLRSRTNLMD